MPLCVLGAIRHGDRRIGAGLVGSINGGIKRVIDHRADAINMSLV